MPKPLAAMAPVEVIARALCKFDGHPTHIAFEGRPMWESYLPQATAVLQALIEHGKPTPSDG